MTYACVSRLKGAADFMLIRRSGECLNGPRREAKQVKRKILSVALLFLLTFFAVCQPGFAATVDLNPYSVSSYTSFPSINYWRADPGTIRAGDAYRNAMVFDFSYIDGDIVGATLQIEAGIGTYSNASALRI